MAEGSRVGRGRIAQDRVGGEAATRQDGVGRCDRVGWG